MQLLAARRFVERGVRFIQIQHGAGGAGVVHGTTDKIGFHAVEHRHYVTDFSVFFNDFKVATEPRAIGRRPLSTDGRREGRSS